MIDQPGAPGADLLSNFIFTADGHESEAALAELFSSLIEPKISSILRQKMNVSLSGNDDSLNNQDALDLAAEVKTRLLPVLHRIRQSSNSNGRGIESLDAYIRTVVLNTYRQFLHEKYPRRLRLKNKIRYVVNNSSEYAFWPDGDGRYVCGAAAWEKSQAHRPSFDDDFVAGLRGSMGGSGDIDNNKRIIALIGTIFRHAGTPISLDYLVSIVAYVLGLKDPVAVYDADETLNAYAASAPDLEVQIEDKISLEHLWIEIRLMPVRHRTALLLNLRGEHDENVLAFLPVLRIASIRQIAEALEMETRELAEMWSRLPLDDNAIAKQLGLTRQQVINLRQSARMNLRRKRI